MKKNLLLVFAAFSFLEINAQKNDTQKQQDIVIEQNEKNNGTTIEIKDGEVFVNGKKIADDKNAKDQNIKVFKKKRMFVNGKEVPVQDEIENEDVFSFSPFENLGGENKPMLGVTTKPTKNNDGAEVEMVTPNSPAQKMGLQVGDVITRINDKNIYNSKDLVEAIAAFKPGEKIDVTYDRNNTLVTKNITLAERQNATAFGGAMPFGNENFMENFDEIFKQFNFKNNFSNPLPNNAPAPKIGISVEDRADGEGVLVNEVLENSVAEKAGIKKQDVIINFDGKSISDVDDLMQALANNASKRSVPFEIKRNGILKKLELSVPKVLKKKEL